MTLPSDNPPIRLQKYLARAGVASRRKCEDLIRSGVVEVNGKKVKEPFFPVLLGTDEVRVNGQLLAPAKAVYYKLFKPQRVLSAMGEDNLTTLEDILPPEIARVFPVGRLDYDAAGLLLLTNDGDLANLLLHPRFHVTKVYNVMLKPTPSRLQLRKLEAGIELDGHLTKPSTWNLYQKLEHNAGMVEVILTE
ncbi:MAG: S4 domain-containing protein, partial [bacterium]